MVIQPLLKRKRKTPEEKAVEARAPPPVKPTEVPEFEDPTKPQIIRNQETGEVAGIIKPDGTVLLGKARDIQGIASSVAGKQKLPEGAVEASDVAKKRQRTEMAEELLPQVGVTPQLPIQAQEVSQEQALKSALPGTATGVGAGIVGGAVLGGTAGTVALPGVGTVAGATAGAVIGGAATFLNSYRGNLKQQVTDNITGKKIALTEGEQNLRNIINSVEAGADPSQALQDFNMQLALIDQAHARLYLDTQSELNQFLGEDGTKELTRFELFNSQGGAREQYILDMQTAILNPTGKIKNPVVESE